METEYAAPDKKPPLGSYAVLTLLYQALVALAVVFLRRSGKTFPRRYAISDVVLAGAATYKLARLITKDKVTSFVRAPFTEYEGEGGPAELEERPRGSGLRHAIGELLVCPYCLGLWISTGFGLGLAAAPRATRFVALVLASLGISDFLQIAYKAAEDKGLRADVSGPPAGGSAREQREENHGEDSQRDHEQQLRVHRRERHPGRCGQAARGARRRRDADLR